MLVSFHLASRIEDKRLYCTECLDDQRVRDKAPSPLTYMAMICSDLQALFPVRLWYPALACAMWACVHEKRNKVTAASYQETSGL